MVCVYCSADTSVKNSRYQKRNNQVWRRRQCQKCGAVFTTHEAADLNSLIRITKRGKIEPFNTDLIFTELLLSLEHRKDVYNEARELTDTVIKQLLQLPGSPVFEASQISREVSKVLERFDKRAWYRYSAEHPSLSL